MLQLSIQDYEGKSTVIPLADGELSIGRDDSNSICLTERNVSRRHAVIMTHGNKVYLENVAATFGTRLNNTLLRDRSQLQTGDVVQIGDYSLQVLGADQIKRDTALVDDGAPSNGGGKPGGGKPGGGKPVENATAIVNLADIQLGLKEDDGEGVSIPVAEQPRLVVESDNLRGWEGRITRSPTTIGRVAENSDLVVDHRSISKEHARLTRKPDGRWEILDLGSANGIQVNGEPYSKCAIRSGDTVVLGHVTLRFLGAGERAPAVAAGASGGKGGGKGLIIAAVALLVLLAGGALAFFMVSGTTNKTKPASGVTGKGEPDKAGNKAGDNADSDKAGGEDDNTDEPAPGPGAVAVDDKKGGAEADRAAIADVVRKVSKLEKAGMLDDAMAFAREAQKKHPGSAELSLVVKRLQAGRKVVERLAAAEKKVNSDPKAVLDAMTDLESDAKGMPAIATKVAALKGKAAAMVVANLAADAQKLLKRRRYSAAVEKAEMCQAMDASNRACADVLEKAKAKAGRSNHKPPSRVVAPPTIKPAARVVKPAPAKPIKPDAPAATTTMSAKDYYKAGRKAAAGGDNQKAADLFEKAVAAGYKRAHGKLARLYFQLGNKSKCASHGKLYVNRYPDAGDAPQIEGLVEKCK